MTFRSMLVAVTRAVTCAVTCALIAATAFATSAAAAPTLVGNARNAVEMANDGNDLYWTDSRTITRVSIAGGAGNVIYRAPRGAQISELDARGGSLAFTTDKSGKKQVQTRAFLYAAATGQTRTVAKANAKMFAKGSVICGSILSLGRVTAVGEMLLVRNSYSLSRKRCKKPVSVRSDVTAAGPTGSRLLFAGDFSPGNPLQKLVTVLDADLNGNALLLTGFGIGTLDLISNQFVLIAPERRSEFAIGRLDTYGNLLMTRLKGSKARGTISLISAESGFSASTTLESDVTGVLYDSCGSYLMRTKFDLKQGQSSSVTVIPNPLKPEGLVGSTPLPLSTQSLWSSSCDATNAAFAVANPTGSGQLLYVAALTG